jgi:hypothetical protein
MEEDARQILILLINAPGASVSIMDLRTVTSPLLPLVRARAGERKEASIEKVVEPDNRSVSQLNHHCLFIVMTGH